MMGPGSFSSLVLDGQRRELVRMRAVSGGKRGGLMLDDEKSKAAIALRNHSEAERRRRERINSHLAILRGMLTGTDKLDKASLLAQVINHVKLLQITAAEHAHAYTIPSHTDQVAVDCCEPLTTANTTSTSTTFLIRASICCDDSPQLYPQLKQSLHNLHERVVRAEISSLSRRVKIVLFIIHEREGEIGEGDHGVKRNNTIDIVASIEQALRSALERVKSCMEMELMPRASNSESNLLNKRRKILHFDSSSSSSS